MKWFKLIIVMLISMKIWAQNSCPTGYKMRKVKCGTQITTQCVPENYSCNSCWYVEYAPCPGKSSGGGWMYNSYDRAQQGAQNSISTWNEAHTTCIWYDNEKYEIYLDDYSFCSSNVESTHTVENIKSRLKPYLERWQAETEKELRRFKGKQNFPRQLFDEYTDNLNISLEKIKETKNYICITNDKNIYQIENKLKELKAMLHQLEIVSVKVSLSDAGGTNGNVVDDMLEELLTDNPEPNGSRKELQSIKNETDSLLVESAKEKISSRPPAQQKVALRGLAGQIKSGVYNPDKPKSGKSSSEDNNSQTNSTPTKEKNSGTASNTNKATSSSCDCVENPVTQKLKKEIRMAESEIYQYDLSILRPCYVANMLLCLCNCHPSGTDGQDVANQIELNYFGRCQAKDFENNPKPLLDKFIEHINKVRSEHSLKIPPQCQSDIQKYKNSCNK